MGYRIEFSPRATRNFKKLTPEAQKRIKPIIDSLTINPRPIGFKKLRGDEELFRVRVGDYRILYQINDQEIVILIVNLGHRREIYRK